MSVAPVVRRVIVCRKVEVTNPGPNQEYAIRGIIDLLRPPAGRTFPYRERGLWVFAQFVDGAGTHPVVLDVVRVGIDSETLIKSYRLPPVHMTRGRFFVLNRAYRLPDVPFPEAGIYEFRVRCGPSQNTDELRLEDHP